MLNSFTKLVETEESRNPALVLHDEIISSAVKLSAEDLLRLEKVIQAAIKEGENDLEKIQAAIGRLSNAQPVPSFVVPWGF